MRLAEARQRLGAPDAADGDLLTYARLCLTAGRPEAAAAALGVVLPDLGRFPDALGPLPAFDPERACTKCGATDAAAAYVPDRLERTCRRCAYRWHEAPLDARLHDHQTEPELAL